MAFPLGPQFGLTAPDAEERGARRAYMHALIAELRELEDAVRLGGGPERIERQRKAGKLLARERIAALLDEGDELLELGLLMAHDAHGGIAPAAGVVTGIGRVGGRQVAVMANDATVKAGSWFPETVSKVLRIQEAAMRCGIPIVYLVDSAGVFLPEQHGTFPGKYGGARIFHNCARMRRQLRIPQISAVMGQCIAGGAYLPALSDVILMVEGTSFMGLGGPNLVLGAIGQQVEAEALGGASSKAVSRITAWLTTRSASAASGRYCSGFRALPPHRCTARNPRPAEGLTRSCRATAACPTTCMRSSAASWIGTGAWNSWPSALRSCCARMSRSGGGPLA